MTRIILTGGHLTPAVATVEELLKKVKKNEIYFIGRKRSMEGDRALSQEFRTISSSGIKFYPLITGRVMRTFSGYSITSFIKIFVGFFHSFFLIVTIRPKVVCSFGGYVGFWPSFWAWVFRIPVVIHEQTLEPGLANKIVGKWATRVTVAFPETIRYFPKRKTRAIGNPIRSEIYLKTPKNAALAKFLQNSSTNKLIYITGGSQGSHEINKTFKSILSKLLSKYFVIHQTGNSSLHPDFALFSKFQDKLDQRLARKYFPVTFIDSADIGAVLDQADLVVGRSGANTVWELAFLNKRAIFVPLPFSASGEQEKNARWFEKFGEAKVILQSNLSPYVLFQAIEEMCEAGNAPKYETQDLPRNAAGDLATIILNKQKNG